MLTCYATASDSKAIPIVPIVQKDFPAWIAKQEDFVVKWISQFQFTAKPETFCWIPALDGVHIKQVLLGISDALDFWPWGALPFCLPRSTYCIEGIDDSDYVTKAAMAWGLGAYEFTRYKKSNKTPAKLVVPPDDLHDLQLLVKAVYLVRDLVNTPAEDMGPEQLTEAVELVASPFNATVNTIVGDDLLEENYPAIHIVGRASTRPPRLIELRWGNPQHPHVTLVGKGVCFDSGGLDIKPTAGMALMKKDMAGAAHALSLAYLVMSASLPVCLHVLIPAVDNVIAGNAYRPGDIITMRKGLTVEVNNTDAEGRLILADSLTAAVAEHPELLLDFTTLTGAARVAMGPDITAMFCNNRELAKDLLEQGEDVQDPIVELPLYKPYRKYLESKVADITNAVAIPYGGAITAGLFLNEFVPPEIPWAHFDLMAWNLICQPCRPEGGEAMAIRAVFSYLVDRFGG